MNIVLCGFMGSGKTTVGKLLKEKLNMPLVDIDEMIENDTGLTISQIFERYGEDGFRKIECDTVKKASEFENTIISTGGGSVLNPDNVTALKSSGKIFFLDVTAETVIKRLEGNTSRPLLQRPDKEQAVRELLNSRRDKYLLAADHTVKSANDCAEVAAQEIISIFAEKTKINTMSLRR